MTPNDFNWFIWHRNSDIGSFKVLKVMKERKIRLQRSLKHPFFVGSHQRNRRRCARLTTQHILPATRGPNFIVFEINLHEEFCNINNLHNILWNIFNNFEKLSEKTKPRRRAHTAWQIMRSRFFTRCTLNVSTRSGLTMQLIYSNWKFKKRPFRAYEIEIAVEACKWLQ